jgi:rubrerythrin
MNEKETLPLLESLAQLDVDAFFAYGQAIDSIEMPAVRRRLMAFRRDHKRHYDDLAGKIRRLGGTPPEFARDAKGVAIEGYTAIRSGMSQLGALRAMHTNEAMTNGEYEAALEQDLPPRIRKLIERNRNDERRHFSYIERTLETRRGELSSGILERPSLLLGAAALLAGIGAVYVAREWNVARAAGDLARRVTSRGAAARRPLDEHPREVHFRAAGMDRPYGRSHAADEGDPRDQGMTDISDVAQNQMPGTPHNVRLNPRDALEEPRRRAFDEAVKNRRDH